MRNRLNLLTIIDLDSAIEFLEMFYPNCEFSIGYTYGAVGQYPKPYIEIDVSTTDKETEFVRILKHGSITDHFKEYTRT